MVATLDQCCDLEGIVDRAPRVTAVYISTDCHVGPCSGVVRVRPVPITRTYFESLRIVQW